MFDFMDRQLSEEETEAVIRDAVDGIKRRGLTAPAMLFIECHKPLAGVFGASSIALAPFIVPFLGFDRVEKATQVFSKRENVERLLSLLEEPTSVSNQSALEKS